MNPDTAFVILGASAAGMAAAHTLRHLAPKSEITVMTDEAVAPYFRPLIPYIISGKKQFSDIQLTGNGPYTAQKITVKTNTRAESIDTTCQNVVIKDQSPLRYDRLLIATGSTPHIPDTIAGIKTKGVYALRTYADAVAMAQRGEDTRHAVLLGGGLLNLKAAFALLTRGIDVTLIVYSAQVLSQLMDSEDAILIADALKAAGLVVKTGGNVVAIASDDSGVTGVVLDDGSEIACQMVCIGKGVRPNSAFLDPATFHLDDGVVVDAHTACHVPGVWAAGDVAVTFNPVTNARVVTGLWTNAVEMGRCAAYNMAGIKTAYTGTFGIMNATQIADMPFVSMGMVHTRQTDYEVHVFQGKNAYRKLVFNPNGERLIGCLLIGDIEGAGLYRYIIREKRSVKAIKSHILANCLHYGHLMMGG